MIRPLTLKQLVAFSAALTLQLALLIAVITLWTSLQGLEADYRLLAQNCRIMPSVIVTPTP